MKTETQVFRGYGKKKEIAAQTAVECRFGQDVETVLTATCSPMLTGAEAGNGEVRYFGKALFSIVYEDAEKHICRAERGVEFTATAKDGSAVPAYTARASAGLENISVRREGAGVYATALIGCDISLYGEQSFEYLSGGDLIFRRDPVKVLTAHLVSGTSEASDEFETEYLTDILQHTETVNLYAVNCETGMLRVEGEVDLSVLALKGGAPVSFERLLPFRIELPVEEAAYGLGAEASVRVTGAALRADADEGKDKCLLSADLTLACEGCVYEEVSVDAVTDAFSTTHVANLVFSTAESAGVGELSRITERVSGKCALSGPVDFTDTFRAVTLCRAEASAGEGGKSVEGIAVATLLVQGADGGYRAVEMSLPFSVPADMADADIGVLVCGMSARQKQEGEVEAEATLKISVQEKKKVFARLVESCEEGEALALSDAAVSVYIPRAGDGLWELAKSLKKSPEDVAAGNPDMEFPIREGQRVIVYRKKC